MINSKLLGRLGNKSLLDLADFGNQGGELFGVFDSSDSLMDGGEALAWLPEQKDVDKAVGKAHMAFEKFSKTLASERAKQLRALAQTQRDNAKDLAVILSLESGKPFREALGEIEYGASYFEWFAEEARRAYGVTMPGNVLDRTITVTKQPVGVCGFITPFNFPNAMLARKMAAALAAGCTVIARPSSETPLSAIALHNMAKPIFPDHAVQVVLGSTKLSSDQGKALCQDKRVRKISFTGSTKVGKLLLEQCAGTVKRTSMELGGNAPVIVYDCAEVDVAVRGIMQAKFRNTGQTCVCANRVFVQSGVFDKVVDGLVKEMDKLKVGNVLDQDTDIGSLIHSRAKDNMESLVKDAVDNGGAKLVVGGETIKGNYYKPTLLVGASSECRVGREEIFGPVLSLVSFTSEQEVISKANAVDVGLAAYVFATKVDRIHRTVTALECGVLGVNTGLISCAEAPFGGVKESGFGREGSKFGLDDYLNLNEPSSTLSTRPITVHALQFLKLYLLSCFENGVKLPLVTEHLVVSIMNVLCEESERQESGHQETRGRRCNPATLTLKQKLLEFHREHYKLTMTNPREKLGFTNKAQLLHRRGCGQGL
ncbi:hypothetical protein BASA81_001043 [Batrachochytrium salamandrivorans]|nr:hypothetical protein BASA81_001043 [Batrachochytrium salamandrivorans]